MPKNKFHPDPETTSITGIDESSVAVDPFLQFSSWYTNARNSGIGVPEAMFLATADKKGIPSGRMVLLKGFDPRGFVFYTNYDSRKGSELSSNPHAAIVFYWQETDRQVRITGKVKRVSTSESDAYFASRPAESRISAMISPQSSVIPGREFLDAKFGEMKTVLHGKKHVRPANWGGFRIIPETFEFWQSRPNRLHDRIRYRLMKRSWVIERLAP